MWGRECRGQGHSLKGQEKEFLPRQWSDDKAFSSSLGKHLRQIHNCVYIDYLVLVGPTEGKC